MQHALLMTNDVALRCGVSPATVRLWERSGRLIAAMRTPRGVRLYDSASVERLANERRAVADDAGVAAVR
jgi:DNA-binding transcriptional MerR regulator